MKNVLNTSNPIREYKKEAKLKNGTKVTVEGFVYDHPIMEGGDPLVYNMVTIVNDHKVIGVAFFAEPMSQEELIDKVDSVSENPDDYLAPHVKFQMNN